MNTQPNDRLESIILDAGSRTPELLGQATLKTDRPISFCWFVSCDCNSDYDCDPNCNCVGHCHYE